MITITQAAADQIRRSAADTHMEGLALRIAVARKPDDSFDYGMGFDDAQEDDLELESAGVKVIVSPGHLELLKGMTLDFVEMEAGELQFIFLNPNDPSYVPPGETP